MHFLDHVDNLQTLYGVYKTIASKGVLINCIVKLYGDIPTIAACSPDDFIIPLQYSAL